MKRWRMRWVVEAPKTDNKCDTQIKDLCPKEKVEEFEEKYPKLQPYTFKNFVMASRRVRTYVYKNRAYCTEQEDQEDDSRNADKVMMLLDDTVSDKAYNGLSETEKASFDAFENTENETVMDDSGSDEDSMDDGETVEEGPKLTVTEDDVEAEQDEEEEDENIENNDIIEDGHFSLDAEDGESSPMDDLDADYGESESEMTDEEESNEDDDEETVEMDA